MAGAAVLALGSVLYAVLLEGLRRRDRGYPSTHPSDSTWWFGYARDAVNVVGWLFYSGGLALLGFDVPASLLLGSLFTLYAYGLDFLLGRVLAVRPAPLPLSVLLLGSVAAVALLRAPIDRGLHVLETLLF